MKQCPKCKTDKPIGQFYAKPERHDGLSGWCIPCEKNAGKDSLNRLYLQVVAHLGDACVDCGYNTPGPALQVDHVSGDGAAERQANNGRRKLLQAALVDSDGRYQLLCANCNQIKRIDAAEHGRQEARRVAPDAPHLKTCSRCKETQPASLYYRNTARYDGLSVYCMPCTAEVNDLKVRRERTTAISHLGDACAQCGYSTDPRALQIDHIAGGGIAARKAMRSKGALYRDVPLAPPGVYQCLCANCNVIKKVEHREFRPPSTYHHNPATERRPTRRYLTEDEIREVIRLVIEEGLTQGAAGAQFGITQSTVYGHLKRRRYSSTLGR